MEPLQAADANSWNDEASTLTVIARRAGAGDPIATRHFPNSVWPKLGRVVVGVLSTVRSRVRLAKEALRKRLESEPELAADLEFRP